MKELLERSQIDKSKCETDDHHQHPRGKLDTAGTLKSAHYINTLHSVHPPAANTQGPRLPTNLEIQKKYVEQGGRDPIEEYDLLL